MTDLNELISILISHGWHEACFEGPANDEIEELDDEIEDVKCMFGTLVVTYKDGSSKAWDITFTERALTKTETGE